MATSRKPTPTSHFKMRTSFRAEPTMGGFLPLLLFVGGDFWPSLSIVLVGGIAGSTLVALLYIPGAYVLVTKVNHRRTEAMI